MDASHDNVDEDPSILDSALLESLFYNEMMLMEESSSTNALRATLFSSLSDDPRHMDAVADPNTYAEKALLRDFGVEGPTRLDPPVSLWPSTTETPTVDGSSMESSSYVTSGAEHDEEKKAKLVTQFATLASRLGITLPPQVVQSLAGVAAGTKDQHPITSGTPPRNGNALATNGTAAKIQPRSTLPSSNSADALSSHVKPCEQVQFLHSAAEAAVMTVTKKRSFSDADGNAAAASSQPAKPAYSKRRKKPRLADCEHKLLHLQTENAMLKRHLANVSQKSQAQDAERIQAEEKMRVMLEQNASPEELDAVVSYYKEMYSDYGRRRHQEILFHLEQLQRLANPTNFTKMGLWTLGQQSKGPDPIAGILQKELDIQPQQGRKIIEQRQKIRNVCSNLKECLFLLGKLKTLCEQKTSIFHDRMTKCREILTPRQVVMLLVWINDHSQVLQSVCPGWGSELRSKVP